MGVRTSEVVSIYKSLPPQKNGGPPQIWGAKNIKFCVTFWRLDPETAEIRCVIVTQ